MKPRKLIPSILLILILLFSFVALSFSQVRQQYIRDFSYLTADLRHTQQKIDDFIDDLKRGDLKAFRYITYDVLERSVLQIKEEALRHKAQLIELYDSKKRGELPSASRNGVPFMEYLIEIGSSSRDKLVRCSLQGLFNLDPRVRLTAVHFLRKLRPEASMQRMVKMAVGIDSEWISYDRAKRDFVFNPPQRLETVASRWEYYREKDLNWPTDVLPGQWGLNDHIHPGLNEGGQNGVTTDLTSARWGEFQPQRGTQEYRLNLGAGRPEVQTRGYTRMSDADKATYMRKVRESQEFVPGTNGAAGTWQPMPAEDDIPYLPEEGYRRYHNQEGPWGTVDLLSYQSDQGQAKAYVPMGQGTRYTYVNCEGYRVIANPFAETMKLDEYITRVVWYNKIKQKQQNCLAIISKDTFSVLWRSIDGELPQQIPFLSTGTATPMLDFNDVEVIINGLHRNKNLLNKWVMMRALKDIYKHTNCPERVKEDINVALWEERRAINRRSDVHGLVLTKESLRVGKLDPVAEHQNEVRALAVAQRGTKTLEKEVLGFRYPNDEIRANAYRLIVSDPFKSEEADNLETKINIRDLHRYRIYAYRDENNDIIDYYRDKDKFFALYRQYRGDSSHEVLNMNLVKAAQTLINALVSGDTEIWKTAKWPEVETAVIITLFRTLLQYEANASNPNYITTFMDQLRVQEVKAEKKNDILVENITEAGEREAAKNYPADSYTDMKRDNIIKAALGGLLNRDPRVRLQCIHFLRRLDPDERMLADVVKAKSVMALENTAGDSPETDDYRNSFIDTNVYERDPNALTDEVEYRYKGIDEQRANSTDEIKLRVPRLDYSVTKYEYQKFMISKVQLESSGQGLHIPYFGEYQYKAPIEELEKLYKFCLRDQLVNKIKSGDVNVIKKMDRTQFSVLAEVIDDEFILDVPFASFHSEPFASGASEEITVNVIRNTSRTDATGTTAPATIKVPSKTLGLPDKYAVFNDQDVKVIKTGIDSTNFLIQKGTGEFLIRFYNSYPALTVETKRDILDALYFYKQDDIVVEEIYLAFEGQNPDGRAVIRVGTPLAGEMNPGGIRVYNSLPIGIRKDIRDAILSEQEQFPEALLNILGVIGKRSPSVEDRDNLSYEATSTGGREVVGRTTSGANTGYTVGNTPTPQP